MDFARKMCFVHCRWNALKDVKTEPNSNDETSSESGDTSGTDSESSSSAVAQEEVITDPKATK